MHGEESGCEKALKEQYEAEMLAPNDYEAERKSRPSICMLIWMGFAHLPTHQIRFASPNTLLNESLSHIDFVCIFHFLVTNYSK
jgi:hypothetical protein